MTSPVLLSFPQLLQLTPRLCCLASLALFSSYSHLRAAEDPPEIPKAQPIEESKDAPVFKWTDKDGDTVEGSFLGFDGLDHALLKFTDGAVQSYSIKGLTPESLHQDPADKVTVLVLGDSMSLGGFGYRIDKRLRNHPGVKAVYTYMACATNPLSWMKIKPYTTAKTRCGYWSIESVEGAEKPHQVEDVYGMSRGSRPSAHEVPKLEDMLDKLKPDILVMQSGNNFFGCFDDHVTIKPKHHAAMINMYMAPVMKYLANHPNSLRRIFWVSSPQAGCVSTEVQDFVYEQIKTDADPLVTMIDSRKLTSYPYKDMGHDKEHFWGNEANDWADRVFIELAQDLFAKPLKSYAKINTLGEAYAQAHPDTPKAPPVADAVKVQAKLVAVTPIPAPEKFAPYKEVLVGYKYEVEKVLSGTYAEKELLVMRPGYIRLVKQKLTGQVGKSYTMEVHKLDATSIWGTVRRDDASESLDLDPYMLVEDELRHPDAHPAGRPKDLAHTP